MCIRDRTSCFTVFWYLSVGSCFSSVMFCSMKFCTFLCRLSVEMITVVLPLSAFTNVMLRLCAFSLSLMAVCISELWLLLSGVLCAPIISVSYTHLVLYKTTTRSQDGLQKSYIINFKLNLNEIWRLYIMTTIFCFNLLCLANRCRLFDKSDCRNLSPVVSIRQSLKQRGSSLCMILTRLNYRSLTKCNST